MHGRDLDGQTFLAIIGESSTMESDVCNSTFLCFPLVMSDCTICMCFGCKMSRIMAVRECLNGVKVRFDQE